MDIVRGAEKVMSLPRVTMACVLFFCGLWLQAQWKKEAKQEKTNMVWLLYTHVIVALVMAPQAQATLTCLICSHTAFSKISATPGLFRFK